MMMLTENIQKCAPYIIYQVDSMAWTFTTDYGVSYKVGFEKEESIWQEGAYQFFITRTNNRNSPLDNKLKETVFAVIEEFFRVYSGVMLYICDTGDDMQAARNRLFERWFNEGESKVLYYFQQIRIVAEDVENYAAIVVQRSNPNLQDIIKDFKEFVNVLSDKPEE